MLSPALGLNRLHSVSNAIYDAAIGPRGRELLSRPNSTAGTRSQLCSYRPQLPSGRAVYRLHSPRFRTDVMVWRVLLTVVVVIGVAFGAFYAWAWNSEIPPTNASATLFDPGIVAKGAQLAAVGNCGICHTRPGRSPT